MLTVRVRSGAFIMIKLENQYEYTGTVKAIPEFFEKVVAEFLDSKWMGEENPKSFGDVYLDGRAIDVKTSNVNAKMSMPNMSSQDVLFNKLKDKDNDLLYHFVVYDYDKENGIVYIKNQRTVFFEELNPECLQVSAQGKGVLQIKNGWLKKRFEDCFVEKMNRTEALVHLAKKTVIFCDKQLEQKTQIKKDMKDYLAKVS